MKTTEEQRAFLEANKPMGLNAVAAPHFALTDEGGKFIMAIGGFVKPIVGWDIGGNMDDANILFNPAHISVPAEKGQKGMFFINPLHSALDLQVIALPNTKNQIEAYVKVQYNGDGQTVKMHSLYVKYRGFLAGFNPSLFTDLSTLGSTISPEGVAGSDWSTAYQVSYISKSYS